MTKRRRTAPTVEELGTWATGLVPDFSGKTASGLWFVLLTWRLNRQSFFAFGYSERDEVEALDRARREAVAVRLGSGV